MGTELFGNVVRKKKFVLCTVVATALLIGCGGGGGGGSGTVKIGGKTWMAKNLNIATANSKCYDNDPANCAKYGRLYTWEDAKSACPSGWRLPSDAEWTALTDAVGGESVAGKKLKSTSGWYNNDKGTDDYGFAALPGGGGNSVGDFDDAGYCGIWWSSTEYDALSAGTRSMYYDDEYVDRYSSDEALLFSVRCVQD